MRKKLDYYLSLLFKPLFFAWLAALVLFVLFDTHLTDVTFAALSVAYGLLILYSVYSLAVTVREILNEEGE